MKIKCEKCGSKDITMQGFRYNKTGPKHKYHCGSCNAWFVPDDGFKKMRHKPEHVVRAVHLRNDGLSLSKVQNQLWQHDGVKVSRWTVSEWHQKYGVFLKSAERKGKAND